VSALLEATGIKRSYRNALDLQVDQVAAGESRVLCLLGPSGAGKSTLLRILGLIEKPDAGEVRIGNAKASTHNLAARRKIAAALQSAPMWRGSVAHNVEYGLQVRGTGRRERRVRAEEALASMGLEGLEGRDANQLSGGQAQRVALARALVVEPEILLLDEPLAHIDEPLRESLAADLRKFTLRTNCATIWVTHDRAEAMSASDEVAVIEDGKLLQSGPAMEVFAKPAGEKVAKLVGADNIIPGKITESTEGLALISPTNHQGALLQVATDLPPGADVWLLVRPEEISIWQTPPEGPSPRNRIKGRIKEIVLSGATAKLHIESLAGGLSAIALITRPTMTEMNINRGSEIWFGFKATSAHTVRRS
jgi:tungstate transport system ATP-binding protein